MTVALACLLRWERTRERLDAGGAGLAVRSGRPHPSDRARVRPGPRSLGAAPLARDAGAAGRLARARPLPAGEPADAGVQPGNRLRVGAARRRRCRARTLAARRRRSDGYLGNLGALLSSLPLLFAGEIGERRGEFLALDDPVPFVYAGIVLGGLVIATRHRVVLPAAAVRLGGTGAADLQRQVRAALQRPVPGAAAAAGVRAGCAGRDRDRRASRDRHEACAGPRRRLRVGVLAVLPVISLGRYVSATLASGPNNRELYRAVEIVAAAGSTKPVLVDASLSGTRVSTGREGTGVLEYLLILDGELPVRRYQADDLWDAVERGESDLVVVSPRLLTRLDKDFITESPPGEARPAERRASFVVARIAGRPRTGDSTWSRTSGGDALGRPGRHPRQPAGARAGARGLRAASGRAYRRAWRQPRARATPMAASS